MSRHGNARREPVRELLGLAAASSFHLRWGAAVTTRRPPTDLEVRVENRKRDLISQIVEHKKNSSRAGAAEAIERAKARLTELALIVKAGSQQLRLDEWMAR